MSAGKLDWVHHNLNSGRVVVRGADSPKRRVSLTAAWVLVADARPNVSAAGRERVVASGVRDVHARIDGHVESSGDDAALVAEYITTGRRISYNPHRRADFHHPDTGETWKGSALVIITGGYAYAIDA